MLDIEKVLNENGIELKEHLNIKFTIPMVIENYNGKRVEISYSVYNSSNGKEKDSTIEARIKDINSNKTLYYHLSKDEESNVYVNNEKNLIIEEYEDSTIVNQFTNFKFIKEKTINGINWKKKYPLKGIFSSYRFSNYGKKEIRSDELDVELVICSNGEWKYCYNGFMFSLEELVASEKLNEKHVLISTLKRLDKYIETPYDNEKLKVLIDELVSLKIDDLNSKYAVMIDKPMLKISDKIKLNKEKIIDYINEYGKIKKNENISR